MCKFLEQNPQRFFYGTRLYVTIFATKTTTWFGEIMKIYFFIFLLYIFKLYTILIIFTDILHDFKILCF